MTSEPPRIIQRTVPALFALIFLALLAFTTTLLTPLDETAGTTKWPVNSYEQTYGAVIDNVFEPIGSRDYLIERCPDLISAIAGDSHELGYVYKEDFRFDLLFDLLYTQEEVLKLMETGGFNRIIPVYALDGRTIVGSMRLGEAPLE